MRSPPSKTPVPPLMPALPLFSFLPLPHLLTTHSILPPSLPLTLSLSLSLSLSSSQVRQAAERGVGSAGFGAAAFMKPLLQNLCLSLGDNEELCYCLKTWQVRGRKKP